MAENPKTSSFHVSAVAAQSTPEGIRLLVRTQETGAFGLMFSPALASQIGLRVIAAAPAVHPTDGKLPRKPGSGRQVKADKLAGFLKVEAVLLANPNAMVSRACRLQVPPVSARAFYQWRRREERKLINDATT